jgi:hypothetical protein
MLGTFLEDPIDVPRVVVDYAAEQLGIDDPSCIKQYAERVPTRYEHAWEIRDLLKFRDFTDAQEEVTAFVGSQVAIGERLPGQVAGAGYVEDAVATTRPAGAAGHGRVRRGVPPRVGGNSARCHDEAPPRRP